MSTDGIHNAGNFSVMVNAILGQGLIPSRNTRSERCLHGTKDQGELTLDGGDDLLIAHGGVSFVIDAPN
jgi:hypothetical protein